MIPKLATLAGATLLFLLLQTLCHYRGVYIPPGGPPQDYEVLRAAAPSAARRYEATPPPVARGRLLMDLSHSNSYAPWELNPLLGRVAARGYQIEYLRESDAEKRLALLEEKLRGADAYAVISPRDPFRPAEVELTRAFVAKGGKLLLVGDPTRRAQFLLDPQSRSELNTLATAFGLAFENDYLYNLGEFEGSFRHVFARPEGEHAVLEGVERAVVYTAGSVRPRDLAVLVAEGASSSLVDQPGSYAVAVAAHHGRVLGVGDLTLFTEPFNTSYSNDRLVANIAQFLSTSERRWDLADFPHFFSASVRVTYSDDSLLTHALQGRELLARAGKRAEVSTFQALDDMLYVGLFDDAGKVGPILTRGGITITERIEISATGRISKENTALLYLEPGRSRHALVVLADTRDLLKEALAKLETSEFRKLLFTERLGVLRDDSRPGRTPTSTPATAAPGTAAPAPTITAAPATTVTPTPGAAPTGTSTPATAATPTGTAAPASASTATPTITPTPAETVLPDADG